MTQSVKTAKGKKDYGYKIATATVELPNGEHKQLKSYGKSQREADSKLRVKIARIKRGESVTNSKTPAMRYFREWLQAAKSEGKRKVGTNTYKEYAGRLERHFLPVFGELALEQIQPGHCEQVLDRVVGGSQSDIDKTYQLLRSGFRAAVDRGLLHRSPMSTVRRPKGTTGKRRSLTAEEYDRLRQAIKDIMASPEDHAGAVYAAIAVGCGLRPGEVAALYWSNVKLKDRCTLTVAGAVKKRTRVIGPPKTEAGRRSVGIPSWLAEILTQYKREQPGNVEFSLLFPDKTGRPLSEWMRRAMWRTVRATAQIPEDIDLYCLRHTFCTRGAKAGVDLRTMRYLMGHESIEITAKIYTEITDDMRADASAAIEALERVEAAKAARNLS